MIAGGWLMEQFSWGAVFLINAPVAVVALIAAQVLVPESKDPAARRIDLVRRCPWRRCRR
jgi:MFS family permease